MTILLNKFSNVLGLPEVTDMVKDQFLINFEEFNMKEVMSNVIGVRSWDLEHIEKHTFLNVIQLDRFFEVKGLNTIYKAAQYKTQLIFILFYLGQHFYNGESTISVETVQLFRRWGSV